MANILGSIKPATYFPASSCCFGMLHQIMLAPQSHLAHNNLKMPLVKVVLNTELSSICPYSIKIDHLGKPELTTRLGEIGIVQFLALVMGSVPLLRNLMFEEHSVFFFFYDSLNLLG
jgi:hypothetical protein